jgi:hypothetical protein
MKIIWSNTEQCNVVRLNDVEVLQSRMKELEQENAEFKAKVERLTRPVTELRREAWFNDWRPIINAIGEISVQEAMDAIERNL